MARVADRGLYSRRNKAGDRVWYVRAGLNGRMRHFGSFPSKTKAREFYERAKTLTREQRINPGLTVEADYTVAQMFAAYLPQAAHRRAYREQRRFANWWSAYWPDRAVTTLTPLDLEQARVALRHSGRLRQRGESTVLNYLRCLKHVMRVMIRPRSWVVDLWSTLSLQNAPGEAPAPLSRTDELALSRALPAEDAHKVRLAIVTGLRRSQLFGLRWERIHWSLRAVALPTIKRQQARYLPLPSEALQLLRRRWQQTGRPATGWVFPHPERPELPEDAGGWYKYTFKPALARAGLTGKRLTFHSTRHTFAVRFLEGGGHVRALQTAGGWSSLDQVEIYTQMVDGTLRAAMESGARVGRAHGRKLQNGSRATRGRRA